MDLEFIKKLVKTSDTKIVMLVMDGIGGLPRQSDNLTELEFANTPNLDTLAKNVVGGSDYHLLNVLLKTIMMAK